MKKRLILVNRMYAGKYLTIGENIGHEIINLIRADNGQNYLWLNADGNCQISKFVDSNGNLIYDEIVMVMVMMYRYREWKVLAKAEIDTSVLSRYMVPNYNGKYHQRQCDIIEEEKIRYGGHPVNDIFNDNSFGGQNQKDVDIYFTFKAKDVRLPLATQDNISKTVLSIKGLSGLSNQSLRMYLSEDKQDNKATYDIFNRIIDGDQFEWESENTTKKVDEMPNTITETSNYFLKIINEEYRELTFSNLLAYFLQNEQIMQGFAEKVLDLPDFRSEKHSIAREEKNIDLFISTKDHYIIIENKIRSGLIEKETGDKEKIYKMLRDYFDVKNNKQLPEKAEELATAFLSKQTHFQTDRYYAYACGVVHQQNSNATIRGYVLCPNYAKNRIERELEHPLFAEHYTLITYEDVHDYFSSLQGTLSNQDNLYLKEFLAAMYLHKKEVDNIFEEEMKNRFYKKIRNLTNG